MAHTHVRTLVTRRSMETHGVVALDLQDPERWPLPPFTAGAHVDIVLSDGLVRQYSLCGDPADGARYRIAVLHAKDGRGGSAAVHRLNVGDTVLVSLPRNHFPIAEGAKRHIMLAGGIGVTPFLSMIPELRRRGEDFQLRLYTGGPESTPFLESLANLRDEGRVSIHHRLRDLANLAALRESLGRPEPGDHVYCCGPEQFMDLVAEATRHWPEEAVHFERFRPPEPSGDPTETGYVVELVRSGRSVPVGQGQSMSDALKAAGIEIDTSCGAGTCGTCKTRYLAGTPIHRDLVLRRSEREQYLTPCVSSCSSSTIELDL